MIRAYAEVRVGTVHTGIARWVGIFLRDGEVPVVQWLCVPQRSHGGDAGVQGIARKSAARRWPGEAVEWLGGYPALEGPVLLVHRDEEGRWHTSDVEGFSAEAIFEKVDESITRVVAERLQRRLWKRHSGGKDRDALARLIARDGPECCWCGKTTSPDLPEKHPLRATVEHVLPTSKGGRGNYRNLRVACRKCNTVRGNKDAHPVHALRPKPPTMYPDPPIMLLEFDLPTTEDWEPTDDGKVHVTAAISGKGHRMCSVYVKGGGVEMSLRFKNTGPEAVARAQEVATSLPTPVTFAGLEALGFSWVPYMEPAALKRGPRRRPG